MCGILSLENLNKEVSRVNFNYSKLRGKIKEVCNTQDNFSNLMGISKASISAKLNHRSEFTQNEMKKAMDVLHINGSDIADYFFTPLVQKIETSNQN